MTEHLDPDGKEIMILEQLRELAKDELNLTSEQLAAIDLDAPIIDALQLDSLRSVVLLSGVERLYGCVFDAMTLQEIRTLRDFVHLIARTAPEDRIYGLRN